MLDLVVVRHGESIRNRASLEAHQGNPSPLAAQLRDDAYEPGWPLTEHGVEQAKTAGAWISDNCGAEPEFAYVSPYLRTLQTVKAMGLMRPFEQDWRLRERHWGDYALGADEYDVERYLADLKHAGELDFRPPFPGGESVRDLVPNLRSFVQNRLSGIRRGLAVLVTHGGTMRALQVLLQGELEEHETAVRNCCLLVYRLETVHADGSATGEVLEACPWIDESPHMAWQHFG